MCSRPSASPVKLTISAVRQFPSLRRTGTSTRVRTVACVVSGPVLGCGVSPLDVLSMDRPSAGNGPIK
jgi:hypothetical protein